MKRRSVLSVLGALPLAAAGAGCATSSPRRPGDGRGASPALDELSTAFESLMGEHGVHEWARYAGESKETEAEAAAKMGRLRDGERDVVQRAAELVERDASAASPRERELWSRARTGLRLLGDPRSVELADRLEHTINEFPFSLSGKRTTRGELKKLSQGDDPEGRRLAHRAYGELHREAAPIARELLRRRRDLARELGLAGGFYPALLALRGLEAGRLAAVFDALAARTVGAFGAALAEAQKRAALPRVAPWDVDVLVKKLGDVPDERFARDEALPFARRVFGALGVDLDKPRIRIDVRDFAFGGQTISIRVPDDVRMVVTPTPGARFYGTLLHELGHAFASTRNREERAVFKGYEWIPGLTEPACDEGVAEVFGRLVDEADVLAAMLPALSGPERDAFLRARARGELITLRTRLAFVAFEREALRDPDQDLDALERAISAKLLGVEAPKDAEPTWAVSPFLATYPVYTQSYVLAAMLSAQVRRAARERFGAKLLSKEAGDWLAEQLVADGTRTTMDEKLKRATGRSLEPDAYAAWLLGGASG